jgi:hypothetical protein
MSSGRPYKEYNLESGKILEIHVHESPESPREWDNLGTVWCSHRRYSLSDKHAPMIDTDDHNGWDAVKEHLVEEEGAVVILPIYMYDHSGISIATTPFGCNWDSGQVGFIYCTGAKIKAEYGGKRITKKIKEKVEACLESEIKTYNHYVTGDVYGFKLMQFDMTTKERTEEDACWGFYGDDFEKNGILDHLGKNDVILKER